MTDMLWLYGQKRDALARKIEALHGECGAASRTLAELAFKRYQNENITLARLAVEAGLDAPIFRSIMWKYIGKAKLKAARLERKGNNAEA